MSTLEDAQVSLGIAVSLIGQHDAVMNQYMKSRAELEFAENITPGKMDVEAGKSAISSMKVDADAFAKHLLVRIPVAADLAELRKLVSTVQVQLDVVAQFQSSIAGRECMLAVYDDSATAPQDLPDDITYDRQTERDALDIMHKQLAAAEALFMKTAAELDIGDISVLVVPPGIAPLDLEL